MKCPVCNAWTSVLETRTNSDKTKRRRYECANLHRFVTTESLKRILERPAPRTTQQ